MVDDLFRKDTEIFVHIAAFAQELRASDATGRERFEVAHPLLVGEDVAVNMGLLGQVEHSFGGQSVFSGGREPCQEQVKRGGAVGRTDFDSLPAA